MSIEASILDTANGSPLGLGALIENLKTHPTETYEALAAFLFAEDPLKYHTTQQLAQLSKCLALLDNPENSPQLKFNWDYPLKDGHTFLTKLCRYSVDKVHQFRNALNLILQNPSACGNWNFGPNNGGTAFFWAMVCTYENASEVLKVLDAVMDRTDFDWNAVNKNENNQDETPLYWFMSCCESGTNAALKALPKLVAKNNLAWLKTAKKKSYRSGTSPLSLLFNTAMNCKESEACLHLVLDKLFASVPNLPTYLDDLMHHENNVTNLTKIKAFIQNNRTRFYNNSFTAGATSTTNDALESFYARLKHAGQQPISKRLLDQITLDLRNAQLDFMIPSDQAPLSATGFHKSEIHRQLRELKPGETYRIPKRYWGLQRTMTVLRSHEGEYELILETKSKLPGHTADQPQKTALYKRNGNYKTGKVAWRIDKGEIKYFHLILKSNSLINHEEFEQEIVLSQALGKQSAHILRYQQGLSRHKGETQQRSAYALGAKGTVPEMHATINAYTEVQKYESIKGLLIGCQRFHHNGYCHHDLSGKNTLFMYVDNTSYLALSDFGTAVKIGSTSINPRTTYGFESPETSAAISTWAVTDNYKYKYYHQHDKQYHSFANEIWKTQPTSIENHDVTIASSADDIWALGINVYRILYPYQYPILSDTAKINAVPLLQGLLAIKRSERIDIDTALRLCDQKLASLKAPDTITDSPPTYTPSFNEPINLSVPQANAVSNQDKPPADNNNTTSEATHDDNSATEATRKLLSKFDFFTRKR